MKEDEQAKDKLEARAERLFSGPVTFLKSAPSLKFLPDPDVPEVALCGRSNVGKSSLLNAITGRKSIARTSVTPGRTQELNFFDVGAPLRFRLVDMPGYGFAKAPVKTVETWRRLVRDFLRGRAALKRTLLLIDSRHGIKPVDTEMMQIARRSGGRLSGGSDQGGQGEGERAGLGARTHAGRGAQARCRPSNHPCHLGGKGHGYCRASRRGA